MYDFTFHYIRRDGTQGESRITDASERAARSTFRRGHRYGEYVITDIDIFVSGKTVVDQLKNMAGMDNITPAQREALVYAADVMHLLEEQAAPSLSHVWEV